MTRERWHGAKAVLLAALALGCGGDSPSGPDASLLEPVDLAAAWATGSPAELGFDVDALDDAFAEAAERDFLRTLIVVRYGRLVREAYFNGTAPDTALDVRSVTKTVTAFVVGLASDRGLLDVEDPISRWLPADSLRPEHQGIRVRHLLTMTSGIRWSDPENFAPWALSGRPVGYVLDLPVVAPPGASFIYNTGGSHLLTVIVGEAFGGSALDLAFEGLFAPLGIADVGWPTFEGQPAGGVALALRATDLAKLGQLVLQRGRSGTRQVLSEAWMDEAFREHVPLGPVGGGVLSAGGYGYQVWTESAPPPARIMWGHGGQFVRVVPDRHLVVVAGTHWRGRSYAEAGTQASQVAGLVRRVVGSAR